MSLIRQSRFWDNRSFSDEANLLKEKKAHCLLYCLSEETRPNLHKIKEIVASFHPLGPVVMLLAFTGNFFF